MSFESTKEKGKKEEQVSEKEMSSSWISLDEVSQDKHEKEKESMKEKAEEQTGENGMSMSLKSLDEVSEDKHENKKKEKCVDEEEIKMDSPNPRIEIRLQEEDEEKEDERDEGQEGDHEEGKDEGNIDESTENSIEKVMVVEEKIVPLGFGKILVVEEVITPHSLKNPEMAGQLDDFFAASGMDFNILLNDTDVPDPMERIFVTPASDGAPISQNKCCHKWEDIHELMEKLNERERRIDSLEVDIKELGRILTENRNERNTLLIDVENLQDENKALEDRNRILIEEKKNQEIEKASLKEKNKKLTVNYQVEMKNVQDKQQDAEEEVNKLKKELNDADKNLKESNANVNALVGQLKTREEEREALENNIENFQSKEKDQLKSQQIELNQFELRFNTEKNRADTLERALAQARDENTRLKNEMKELKQNNKGSNEQSSHYAEFLKFKGEVLKEIGDLKENQMKSESRTCGQIEKNEEKRSRKKKNKKKQGQKEEGEASKQAKNRQVENTDSSSSSSEDEGVFESVEESDDSNQDQPKVHEQYNRKTLVLSTSITRDINPTRFNTCFGHGRAWFERKRGWKIKHIKEDVHKNLQQEAFDNAIVQIGGNDLQDMYSSELITKSAVNIIETANICKERGAKTVFVGGVTERQYDYSEERCGKLNMELKELCHHNGFIYIDNTNILPMEHIDSDRVHLNDAGTKILANNYLDSLRKTFGEEKN